MESTIQINTRPLQEIILNNPARKIAVCAHRRFGKTVLSLMKIIQRASKKVNSRYFYIAPTYKQAKLIAWDMLLQILRMATPNIVSKTNISDLTVKLVNGASIELKGADYPDSLRGVGLDGAVIDEYPLCDPSIYSEIIRPALTDRKGWVLFPFTPKGKNHAFDMFMGLPESDRYLFKATDTNIIDEEELELARKEMSEDEFNQEFMCDFLYFSGQVYKELKPEIHTIKPFPIDDTWLKYCVIDYGHTNPTAVLWIATDFDDVHYVFDEHYEALKTIKYHCETIRGKGYNLRTIPYLDGKCFAKNQQKDGRIYSIADEFSDNGVPCMPAQNDPGSVLPSINRVKEYLNKKKLYIFKNCENLIKEMGSYRWKDKKAVDANLPEEPMKVNDHACFVEDTMIETVWGKKKIKDIQAGEEVYTSHGHDKVIDSQQTGVCDIYEATFSNGSKLRATKDHKIYTNNGKTAIDTLRYGDIIDTWDIHERFNLRDYVTTGTGSIIPKQVAVEMGVSGCTLRYGKTRTAQFLLAIMSTILTSTQRITALRTLFAYQGRNIYRFMQRGIINFLPKNTTRTLQKSDISQWNGTDRKLGESGIENTQEKTGRIERVLNYNVKFVGRIIKRLFQLVRNSVILIANNKPFVIGVRPLNYSAPVYNLTVANSHNYFANGILVSNCDALRYYILSRPENPKWPKYKRTQLDRYRELTRSARAVKDWYAN